MCVWCVYSSYSRVYIFNFVHSSFVLYILSYNIEAIISYMIIYIFICILRIRAYTRIFCTYAVDIPNYLPTSHSHCSNFVCVIVIHFYMRICVYQILFDEIFFFFHFLLCAPEEWPFSAIKHPCAGSLINFHVSPCPMYMRYSGHGVFIRLTCPRVIDIVFRVNEEVRRLQRWTRDRNEKNTKIRRPLHTRKSILPKLLPDFR